MAVQSYNFTMHVTLVSVSCPKKKHENTAFFQIPKKRTTLLCIIYYYAKYQIIIQTGRKTLETIVPNWNGFKFD